MTANDHEPLTSYPLRSSAMYGFGMVVAIAIAATPIVILGVFGTPPPRMGYLWLVFAVFLLAPVLVWHNAKPFRIPGGRGRLAIFANRVELPGGVSLPLAGLRVRKHEIVNRYMLFGVVPAGDVVAARLLIFETERGRHTLGGRLFEHPDCVDAVINDIALVRAGHPPQGIAGLHPPKVDANDPRLPEYEAQLDAELTDLD